MVRMRLDIAIEAAVRKLTAVEQAVLRNRFGIPTDDRRSRYPAKPVSAAQLRRIEHRALRKLWGEAGVAAAKRVHPTTAGDPDWSSMENAELLNMAVFKLHDCAQRMLALAQAAQSPALSATFLSVYRQLLREEADLQTAAHAAVNLRSRPKSASLTAA